MSVRQYPDAINAPELQIWTNAAFDNGESEDSSAAVNSSWSALQSVQFVDRSESIESDLSKENLSPLVVRSPVSVKASVPFKPLNPNCAIGYSQGKPMNLLHRKGGFAEPVPVSKSGREELSGRDERKIDSEIEEIENEISRLASKLEALRMEKIERNAKIVEKRGRVVPAKFMEQKQSVKMEEPLLLSAKSKLSRRGFSLGPAEIAAAAGARSSRQMGKPEITPVQPIQNRRKSCFWKLQEIDERKVTKERGQSLSLSPKSRKTVTKIQAAAAKQAATTVGSRKLSKRDDGVLATIQPKKLFRDGEKSVTTAKKPARTGRVVPSRYNQSSVVNVSERKRSLPEDGGIEDGKRCDKRRASLVGRSWGNGADTGLVNPGSEIRVKKKWEIPSEIVVYKGVEQDVSPPSTVIDVLPRIRTNRFVNDSPRNSGAAKRKAELIGRRSVFCPDDDDGDDEEEVSVCQALSFAEDGEEE